MRKKYLYIRAIIDNYYLIQERSYLGDYKASDLILSFDEAYANTSLTAFQSFIVEEVKNNQKSFQEIAEEIGSTKQSVNRSYIHAAEKIADTFFERGI